MSKAKEGKETKGWYATVKIKLKKLGLVYLLKSSFFFLSEFQEIELFSDVW